MIHQHGALSLPQRRGWQRTSCQIRVEVFHQSGCCCIGDWPEARQHDFSTGTKERARQGQRHIAMIWAHTRLASAQRHKISPLQVQTVSIQQQEQTGGQFDGRAKRRRGLGYRMGSDMQQSWWWEGTEICFSRGRLHLSLREVPSDGVQFILDMCQKAVAAPSVAEQAWRAGRRNGRIEASCPQRATRRQFDSYPFVQIRRPIVERSPGYVVKHSTWR